MIFDVTKPSPPSVSTIKADVWKVTAFIDTIRWRRHNSPRWINWFSTFSSIFIGVSEALNLICQRSLKRSAFRRIFSWFHAVLQANILSFNAASLVMTPCLFRANFRRSSLSTAWPKTVKSVARSLTDNWGSCLAYKYWKIFIFQVKILKKIFLACGILFFGKERTDFIYVFVDQ